MIRLIIRNCTIITLIFIVSLIPGLAQESGENTDNTSGKGRPLFLSLGSVRTENETAAIRLLVEYTSELGEIDIDITDRFWGNLSPYIRFQTGEKDAFSGIIAQLGGNFYSFSYDEVDGINVENTRAFFHVFPLGVGAETNREFNNLNALLEFGYVPWYQNIPSLPDFIRKSKIGIFLQSGYKFKTRVIETDDGSTDQIRDNENDPLFRLKGVFGFNPKLVFSGDGQTGVSILGHITGWWDIIDKKEYYRVDATFRIHLSSDKFFDLTYERGSGAPNFNIGDQFSANITIQF
jgi:hypothetical protein